MNAATDTAHDLKELIDGDVVTGTETRAFLQS
jgi:hypothetical protein